MKYFLLFTLGSWFTVAPLSSGVVVESDPSDIELVGPFNEEENWQGSNDAFRGWIGVNNNISILSAGFFFFQLPTPTAGELPIVTSATFSFYVEQANPTEAFGIDLYGLPARPTPFEIDLEHIFGGELMIDFSTENYFGEHDTTAVRIQDDIVPRGNTMEQQWFETSAVGSQILADYLTDQYGPTGEGAGKYVLLRMNPDMAYEAFLQDPIDGPTGVLVNFAGVGPWDGEPASRSELGNIPTLTLEFAPVPEPSGAIVVATALSAGTMMARRRSGRN